MMLASQRRLAARSARIAYGTDCGMYPFSHGNLEYQAMVAAWLSLARALQAATGNAAELLGHDDICVLETCAIADIVAMPGDPIADVTATTKVDLVVTDGRVRRQPEHP